MRDRVFDMIEAEVASQPYIAVLAITGQKESAWRRIRVRRALDPAAQCPYVDPMHLIQIEHLQRKTQGAR